MNKERFLDVNGFNTEYDIPLERRLNKYRKGRYKDASRVGVSEYEKLRRQSASWRSSVRRTQVITAVIAAVVFVGIVALAWYLTFGF